MDKYRDFSLHFTIKNQPIEELKKKFYDFDAETLEQNAVLVTELDNDVLVLHHCFLPPAIVAEKGLPTGVLDFLDTACDEQVRWFTDFSELGYRRYAMLRNLKRIGGCAVFLGEIKDGVKFEYELAKQLEIPCILIN